MSSNCVDVRHRSEAGEARHKWIKCNTKIKCNISALYSSVVMRQKPSSIHTIKTTATTSTAVWESRVSRHWGVPWNRSDLHSSTHCKTSADLFIDYCGIIHNIEEQYEGIFIADIYLKIFEDNVLNIFDKYFFNFFSHISPRDLKIKIRDILWYSKLLQNIVYCFISSTIQYRFLQNLYRIICTHKMQHSLR